jgi:hypothetical protein
MDKLLFLGRGGGETEPPGTAASNGPTVPAPNNRWENGALARENWIARRINCASATSSINIPAWNALRLNPYFHTKKPAANIVSYDAGLHCNHTDEN